MKYFLLISSLVLLYSCSSEEENNNQVVESDGINWDDENGTLEIVNNTNKDIVVFHSLRFNVQENILGGVKALSAKTFDVSNNLDFDLGSDMFLRGVSLNEYENNKTNPSAAKTEFTAMALYKKGQKFRIAINSDYTGDYGFIVTNYGQIGMELRKNGMTGKRVAYLQRSFPNKIYTGTVYAATPTPLVLYPVFVHYNFQAQTTSTLIIQNSFEPITISPHPVASDIGSYSFPSSATNLVEWKRDSLISPVAYVKIKFNVENQIGYVTIADSDRLYSQNGYDTINSGELLVYEIESTEEGTQKALAINMNDGSVQIPVLFEGEAPILKNGYDYLVQVQSDYTATIVEVEERDPFVGYDCCIAP